LSPTFNQLHALPLQEISSKSIHNFFSYPMDRQTDRQTNKPVGDMDRTYTGDADAVIDYGLLIAT